MTILIKLLRWLLSILDPKPQNKGDIKIMYIVKDDNPDVGFSVEVGDVEDAEGNVISDADVVVDVVSDNESVVAVSADESGKTGTVSFGAPGVANLNATVKSGDTILASFAASFTVTTGDPASIVGGDITFDGLTEA